MREQAGFDMILLDLDGTLIDSEKGIVNSVIYALEKFGIEKEREELLPFIGPPLVHSFPGIHGIRRGGSCSGCILLPGKFRCQRSL